MAKKQRVPLDFTEGVKVDEKPKFNPNEVIDLEGIDYTKMYNPNPSDKKASEAAEEMLDEYLSIVDSLPAKKEFDFVQMKAIGVGVDRFDDNLNKVKTLVGIRIIASDPISTTRITAGMARNLNQQITGWDNPASNSRYYFLKK